MTLVVGIVVAVLVLWMVRGAGRARAKANLAAFSWDGPLDITYVVNFRTMQLLIQYPAHVEWDGGEYDLELRKGVWCANGQPLRDTHPELAAVIQTRHDAWLDA